MTMAAREPQNPYVATNGSNDAGSELVQLVINYYRGHRSEFTPTMATNVGTAVTNILNGTNKV